MFVGVTYGDDIQDAEEAVDAVAGVNLLHHVLFAILKGRNTTRISEFTSGKLCLYIFPRTLAATLTFREINNTWIHICNRKNIPVNAQKVALQYYYGY